MGIGGAAVARMMVEVTIGVVEVVQEAMAVEAETEAETMTKAAK